MDTFINNNKLFISEEVFKSMIPSARNVSDTQTIYYSIAISQNNVIKDMMGRDFYDDMVSKYTLFVDSGTSMTTEYSYLMNNYLKPILAFSTYKRMINNMSFKLRDGGLRSSVDANSELAQYQDRQSIIQEITNDINQFINDMKHYIHDNAGAFPLYKMGFEGSQDGASNTLSIGKVENPHKNVYQAGLDIRKNYYGRYGRR